jgi:hypothetical protein
MVTYYTLQCILLFFTCIGAMHMFMELNFKGKPSHAGLFFYYNTVCFIAPFSGTSHTYTDTSVRSTQSFHQGPLNAAAAALERDDE